jgi:Ca2+-binding RTX toxin-like protein
VEKILGSAYADIIWTEISNSAIDGGGGNDDLAFHSVTENGRLYGGAGNDWLHFVGQEGAGDFIGYGGSGNDRLCLSDMTGGSGYDTFVLDYTVEIFPGNGGAIVRDFTHGFDHIVFTGDDPATLTHVGDTWTVQAENEFGAYSVSFEIDGVTSLGASEYDLVLA